MKKRVRIIISAVAALMLIFSLGLAACGSASGSSSSAQAAASEAKETAYDGGYRMSNASATYEEAEYDYEDAAEPAAAESAASASGVTQKAYNGEVKLIYRADVTAETKDIEQACADLEELAASMEGYVEYSDLGNYGYGSNYSRHASYTVRIPSSRYEAFLAALNTSGSCSITGISKSTEDVGAQYADTEARLKTLRIKQERLQDLLARAENMEDIISIENALTDVEYEIEWNSSTLNRYDALVNYSTVTVYLQQVARETQNAGSASLTERIASSFRNGISSFATGFENFMVAIAGAIIPLLIVAAIIIIIVLAVRRAGRKNREGSMERKMKKSRRKEKNTDNNITNGSEHDNMMQ